MAYPVVFFQIAGFAEVPAEVDLILNISHPARRFRRPGRSGESALGPPLSFSLTSRYQVTEIGRPAISDPAHPSTPTRSASGGRGRRPSRTTGHWSRPCRCADADTLGSRPGMPRLRDGVAVRPGPGWAVRILRGLLPPSLTAGVGLLCRQATGLVEYLRRQGAGLVDYLRRLGRPLPPAMPVVGLAVLPVLL